MTDANSALAKLRPPAGADHAVWAARITACWRASVEAIFEVGRLLISAKESLPHGAFGVMIESELPFGASTAQRLMSIAADVRLSNPAHGQHLPPSWRTLYELTKLPDEEFEQRIKDGTIRPDMLRRDLSPARAETPQKEPPPAEPEPLTIEHDETAPPVVVEAQPEPEPQAEPMDEPVLPNGARSIMASRTEPEDSLDYAPTPPWATRALIEKVLPEVGIIDLGTVWEPACGEGHMTGILEEYTESVFGTDISDYSVALRPPPRWLRLADFLDKNLEYPASDWIITNPPYSKAEDFTLLALDRAEVGVAMFVRWQWIETIGRYQNLFNPFPPALVCPFAERVPLAMRKYDPNGSTATAYCWVVWLKNCAARDTRLFWIPPGCRKGLTKPDDIARFTAHPVKPRVLPVEDENQDRPEPSFKIERVDWHLEDRPPSIDFIAEGEVKIGKLRKAVAILRSDYPDREFEVVTVNGKTVDLDEESNSGNIAPAANEGGDHEVKDETNSLDQIGTDACTDFGTSTEVGEGVPPPDDPASADTIPGQCPPIPEILRRTEG